MRKFLLAALLVLCAATVSHAQATIVVTASHIQNLNGANLVSGSLCFQATDQNDNNIGIQVSGGGTVISSPFCTAVASGVISGFSVPNPSTGSPLNFRYRIYITQGSRTVAKFPLAYLCNQAGACTTPYAFNFDNCLSSGACVASPIPLTTGPAGPAGAAGPTLNSRGAWSSLTTYNQYDSVTYSGGSYYSLVGSNLNNIPSSSPTQWFQLAASGSFATNLDNSWTNNNRFCGTTPFADVTCATFGARAVVISLTDGGTTVSCTSTLATVTIGSASNFINGDGVTLLTCGPVWNHGSTPCVAATGLTVTPSFAAAPVGSHIVVTDTTAGATTYYYRVVARDVYGGLCAPSASTQITTGRSSLGIQTANVTATSRANNLFTFTTTTTLVNGTMISMGQQTPMSMLQAGGWGQVASNSGTQITVPTARSATAMPFSIYDQTSAGSGGEIAWLQGNALAWNAVTGASNYYICYSPDNSTWSLIGVTKFSNPDTGWTDTAFEDFGSSYTGNQTYPSYVTSSICNGSAKNDPLTTTISSGGGSTSLTLANAASNTTSGTILHDAAPNILAAIQTVASGGTAVGTAYIPPAAGVNCYPINSYMALPQKVKILQAGALCLGESIKSASGGNLNWSGDFSNYGAAQFATTGGASISVRTNTPGLILEQTSNLDHLDIVGNGNASTVLILDNFNGNLTHSSFQSAGGSTDVAGIPVISRDNTGTIDNVYMSDDLINGGPGQIADGSWAPVLLESQPAGNAAQWFHMSRMQWSTRGMALTGNNNCPTVTFEDGTYRQGGITPMLTHYGCSINGYFSFKHERQDTEGQPRVFAMETKGSISGTVYGGTYYFEDTQSGSAPEPMLITGYPPQTLVDIDDLQDFPPAMPNLRANAAGFSNSVVASPFQVGSAPTHEALNYLGMPTLMTGGFSLGAGLPPPTAILSSAPTAGGSIPTGAPGPTYVWDVASADERGALSIVNPNVTTSQTVTGGNQTEALTWTRASGAASYNIYRAPVAGNCVSGGPATLCSLYQIASGITTASYTDTSASTSGNSQTTAGAAMATGLDNNGSWATLSTLVPHTFATLASCTSGITGQMATVTDSTTTTWGATITGGSTNTVLAFCDGSNWTVYGK